MGRRCGDTRGGGCRTSPVGLLRQRRRHQRRGKENQCKDTKPDRSHDASS